MQIAKLARSLLPLSLMAVSAAATPASAPVFPAGYRNWLHVKSAVVGPASPAFERFGGLHSIYANGKAVRGFATGVFPEGSILVFDVFHATATAAGVEPNQRRQVDVMIRDKRFAASGGWGFAEFGPEARPSVRLDYDQGVARCAGCHAKAKGGVYSRPL